jgi:hypothetical protein
VRIEGKRLFAALETRRARPDDARNPYKESRNDSDNKNPAAGDGGAS